jgi:hypothetical protein
MHALTDLQNWYHSQCNGDWEHSSGVEIGTMDNPGWSLTIDLAGTDLESAPFPEHSYGVGLGSEANNYEWLSCKTEGKQFKAYGGPHKLEEMIKVFLEWKDRHSTPL